MLSKRKLENEEERIQPKQSCPHKLRKEEKMKRKRENENKAIDIIIIIIIIIMFIFNADESKILPLILYVDTNLTWIYQRRFKFNKLSWWFQNLNLK